MVQEAWIALIIVGVLVVVGVVLYLVLNRNTVIIFPPNGYRPEPSTYPNGYNPHLHGYNLELSPGPGSYPTGFNPSLPPGPGPTPSPGPGSYPNGFNPSLPPGPGPLPAAHATGYNPNLTPSTSHTLLPGVTKKDLSEAFASPF